MLVSTAFEVLGGEIRGAERKESEEVRERVKGREGEKGMGEKGEWARMGERGEE